MKKYYSKKLNGEAYVLAPEQRNILKQNGYQVPSTEEMIAEAALSIKPPKDKRAFVVFDCKTGTFSVRIPTVTLMRNEIGGFVSEVIVTSMICKQLEAADPDRPKQDAANPAVAAVVQKALANALAAAMPSERPEVVE